MRTAPLRIVVALEPLVVESAVAHLLRHRGGDVVVEAGGRGGGELAARFDVAVVDRERPDLLADLVIRFSSPATLLDRLAALGARTRG